MIDHPRPPVRLILLSALMSLALGSVSCTDLALAKFRDDRLIETYQYVLGERYIEIDGLKLCYQEQGEGPTVLILPGLATNADYWQLNVPVLAQHHRMIVLEYPGLGKSDKPDASYELPWLCDRILAFLDAKGIDRVSVIGGSLGGHLGLLLALDHPERVEKLVMMGSVGAWPPPNIILDLALKTLWTDWAVTDYMRIHWPDLYHLFYIRETPLTRRLYTYQLAQRAGGDRLAAEGRAFARSVKSIFYHSCRYRLSDVSVPVLLIWGELDEIHPANDALYMREHMPDARIVIVPNSAHEAMIDQATTFNDVVGAFLDSGTIAVADSVPARMNCGKPAGCP